MTATVSEARDAMYTQFRTVWLADGATAAVPIQFPDVAKGVFPPKGQDTDKNPLPWIRAVILHNPGAGGQANLANAGGQRRYERFGTITVSLFTPLGDGLKRADDYIRVAKSAFEGIRLTPTGVIFTNVRFTEVGPDGSYFMINVIADFDYSEVR